MAARPIKRQRLQEDLTPSGNATLLKWHATDISWPPRADTCSTSARTALEENKGWLVERGVNVYDNVDAFDILRYLRDRDVKPEDVVLCVFNCAHGRNYRDDSDARHHWLTERGWSSHTFRSAVFQAMNAQLPAATCVLTSRYYENVNTCLSGRRILQSFVQYSGPKSGPLYKPEPSTRGDRREGGLGPVEDLMATVSVGPLMDHYLLRGPPWNAIDIPDLVLAAHATGGVILFLGEFTLANARHCVQYVLDHVGTNWSPPQDLVTVLPECRLTTPERRCDAQGCCYTYVECLQQAQEKEIPHPALVAADMWRGMWARPC